MKKYIYTLVGLVFGCLLTYFLMKQFQSDNSTNESHVIAYEIKKLNKMIVAEQMFSDIYSHKNSKYIPGFQDLFSFDKKVVLLVNAKVQATYDMSGLEVDLDTIQKKIIIEKVPELVIDVYPDVKFYDLDQSKFNSFEKDELNQVKAKAIKHIEKTFDEEKLKREAHQQLMTNLGEIYLLAKIYQWEIVDKTTYAKELQLKYN